MPASDALLNSTAALLLIALIWQSPRVARRMRVSGLGFASLGALLPLLDPVWFSFGSEDQIAFLTQDPLFAGPLPSLAVVLLSTGAALLLGAPGGRCLRWAGWTTAGLVLAVGLAGLTPGGAPWLAPFTAHRFSLPLLPLGHLWLIVIAASALALLELGPRLGAARLAQPVGRRWVLGGAAVLLATLLLPGAVACGELLLASNFANGFAGKVTNNAAFAVGATKPAAAEQESAQRPEVLGQVASQPQPQTETDRDVELDPLWPGRWLDIGVEGNDYVAVSKGLGSAGDAPSRLPRWNDQLTLLQLLDDPIVRRMYFEVFRHPVVRTESSGSKILLTVRELSDALVDGPGPALRMETDARGQLRHYQVDRLD